ncbi:DotU/TssL family secretion system protein [Paraburkholderia phymatum]|uniref:Type IV / VI secretion system protein, DotU family n=1 Tax=Paraburkholderia phymatum (strain DSM 17167 / CIP 108236 / LMG 21445 / STM815) TaxID=391038 RepID=B2JW37_PARP8|nr:DotU/TssL family secretion system protein [Paraburkholderia phymatum]ACC75164.1 type IV / VI secretion system protein, DotU family [Paraburkholderia phymatum STM815]
MSATAASPQPRYEAEPAAPYRERVRAAEGAANPLLEAARPLLDALANTPAELDAAGVAQHRLSLVQHLRMFGKVCGELRLPAEHIEKAQYCLCSALDEAAGLTDWGNGSRLGMDWRATGLATTSGYDRQGGDRVYAIATDAMHNQRENRCLIEVIQHILDRGFRGRYRFANDSDHQIAVVRKQVDQAVVTSGHSPPVSGEHMLTTGGAPPVYHLRVEAQPLSQAPRKSRRWMAIGALCLVLLAGAAVAGYWRYTKVRQAEPPVSPIDALAGRLAGHLADEVNAGTVTLAENAQHTTLSLRLEGIFEAGQSSVNPWVKPLITTIGQEVAKTPGRVLVTGHTDSQPFSHMQRSSNLALSDARAQEVAQILVSAGVATDRIDSTGKGNAEPAADNATPQGRLRNRRVEITVFE